MTNALGPVSAALEADVRKFILRNGIAVWLDGDRHYDAFVDRLAALRAAGELPYAVHAFRGSWLELVMGLESVAGGIDRPSLLIHLPGLNEDTVRETPIFDLYRAGARYRIALDRLVSDAAGGKVHAGAITAFLAEDGLSLARADGWLGALLDDREGGLAATLRGMALAAIVDDLLGGGSLATRLGAAGSPNARAVVAVVWEHLVVATGMPARWQEEFLHDDAATRPEEIADAVASWALCVEYVHDLRREPVSLRLREALGRPRPVIDECRQLATRLRQHRPDYYRRIADETETWLADEIDQARAEDLGDIDTFRFEEDKVLQAAMAALDVGRWEVALRWAGLRVGDASFWTRTEAARRSAWLLVHDAARLGAAIAAAGASIGAKDSIESALERYVKHGAAVDQAHRHLEQRRTALIDPQMPDFDALRARTDRMRSLWRDWADGWAREFNALCRAQGFVPPATLQQRTLFDEVVRPMCLDSGGGITAYFVIDAFRYEMAMELVEALGELPATQRQLRPRLAELPTVTEVGMNVLAPVSERGRLRPVMSSSGGIDGFTTGEFRVKDPETRQRAMRDRVGGVTCPWLTLEDVVQRDSQTSLKQRLARARLVVVHSQEIDNAGEKGLGPAVFDQVLQQLRAAWRLLREVGVRRFVFTADHGFLLLDESRPAQSHGRRIDPKRRHVFSSVPVDHGGEARVALADLGYDDLAGHLMFPETTAVFDTGDRRHKFVHGGNSLQERVIPVLTLEHRAPVGASAVPYRIDARALEGVAGMHCIEATVDVAAQGALDFGGRDQVELGLRVTDPWEVQVELCQTRGGARLRAGAVVATVGQRFELFFRLSGAIDDARVRVQLIHAGSDADVQPCTISERFAVARVRSAGLTAPSGAPVERAWLEELPTGGVRQLFEHLAVHGHITEAEAANILGGPRELRRFSVRFEEYCRKAPFEIRIDAGAAGKRYVRDGALA